MLIINNLFLHWHGERALLVPGPCIQTQLNLDKFKRAVQYTRGICLYTVTPVCRRGGCPTRSLSGSCSARRTRGTPRPSSTGSGNIGWADCWRVPLPTIEDHSGMWSPQCWESGLLFDRIRIGLFKRCGYGSDKIFWSFQTFPNCCYFCKRKLN